MRDGGRLHVLFAEMTYCPFPIPVECPSVSIYVIDDHLSIEHAYKFFRVSMLLIGFMCIRKFTRISSLWL